MAFHPHSFYLYRDRDREYILEGFVSCTSCHASSTLQSAVYNRSLTNPINHLIPVVQWTYSGTQSR